MKQPRNGVWPPHGPSTCVLTRWLCHYGEEFLLYIRQIKYPKIPNPSLNLESYPTHLRTLSGKNKTKIGRKNVQENNDDIWPYYSYYSATYLVLNIYFALRCIVRYFIPVHLPIRHEIKLSLDTAVVVSLLPLWASKYLAPPSWKLPLTPPSLRKPSFTLLIVNVPPPRHWYVLQSLLEHRESSEKNSALFPTRTYVPGT